MRTPTLAAILMIGSLGALQAASVHVQRSGGGERRDESSGSGTVQAAASAPPATTFSNPAERTRVVRSERLERSAYQRGAVPSSRGTVRVIPRAGSSHRDPYYYRYHRGSPWYGYYRGSNFYWRRWYSNRWWWYDPALSHWAMWWNGFWWAAGPAGVTYVYVNDGYYPYRADLVPVEPPASMAGRPPDVDVPLAPAESTQRYKSPDGKRMVQLVGEEAFLYDTTSVNPRFIRFLSGNIEKVRFSGGTHGRPLRILLDFKEGNRFELYDANGSRLDRTDDDRDDMSEPPEPPASLP